MEGTLRLMDDRGGTHRRDPWLGVFLSWIMPGFGQMYAGHTCRGVFFVVAQILLMTSIFFSFYRLSFGAGFLGPLVLTGLWVIFGAINLWDAYRLEGASRTGFNSCKGGSRGRFFLPVFLSAVFPGAGQLLNRRFLKGIAFMLSLPLVLIFSNFRALGIVFQLLSMADAWRDSGIPSERDPGKDTRRLFGFFLLWLVLLPLHGVHFLSMVSDQCVKPWKVESDAMSPGLRAGDLVFVNRLAYRLDPPKPGDLIVFERKEGDLHLRIRRAAAVAGDMLEFDGGRILINRKPWPGIKGYELPEVWKSMKPEKFYQVPKKAVYVLSDNPLNLLDSRTWGAVPIQFVFGKAFVLRAAPVLGRKHRKPK